MRGSLRSPSCLFDRRSRWCWICCTRRACRRVGTPFKARFYLLQSWMLTCPWRRILMWRKIERKWTWLRITMARTGVSWRSTASGRHSAAGGGWRLSVLRSEPWGGTVGQETISIAAQRGDGSEACTLPEWMEALTRTAANTHLC